jgi:hypothetical protein
LKADCDQRYRWRFFISGIDQVFGSFSHFFKAINPRRPLSGRRREATILSKA